MFTLVLLFGAANTRVLNSGLLVVSASIAEKGAMARTLRHRNVIRNTRSTTTGVLTPERLQLLGARVL